MHRLIASTPSVCICDQCLQTSADLLRERDPANKVLTIGPASPKELNKLKLRCSFCHKEPTEDGGLVASPSAIYMCDECVEACIALLREEEEHHPAKKDC